VDTMAGTGHHYQCVDWLYGDDTKKKALNKKGAQAPFLNDLFNFSVALHP